MKRFQGAALVLVCSTAAWAGPARGPFTQDLRGTIGPFRVGCELVLDGDRSIEGGHYFYASKLADIPLTGTIEGETVTLKEPGGGTFRLHFVGNGSDAGQPLTFTNAVGLAGTWAGDGKTLPVTLDLDSAMDGPPPARRYADVTESSDAAFEARVQAFVAAVLHGDREAAAGLVSYPLRINGQPAGMIRSKRELLSRWDAIFTPPLKAAIQDGMPHDMFVRNGQAMIGNGVVWFDDTGATSINEPRQATSGAPKP